MKLICTSLDENYTPYGAVFLETLFTHNKGFDVSILDNGLSTESRALLQNIAARHAETITFVPVDFDGLDLPLSHHFTPANYARLFIPEYLNLFEGTVIYIDADTLIMDSVAPLFELDLSGFPVGAVPTAHNRHHNTRLGLHKQTKYLNSGVLVFEAKTYRSLAKEFCKTIHDYGNRLTFVDQDVLNIVLKDNWLSLEPVWNFTHDIASLNPMPSWAKSILEDVKIVHFTGTGKPFEGNQEWHPYYDAFHQTATAIGLIPAKTAQSKMQPASIVRKILHKIERRFPIIGTVCYHLSRQKASKAEKDIKELTTRQRIDKEKELADKYFPERVVYSGPFKGMKHGEFAVGSSWLPKLLGSYESELHQAIISLLNERNYSIVYDVGCAEGYYACGVARLLPNTPVKAFDIQEKARTACSTMATSLGLSNLTTEGFFDLSLLEPLKNQKGLIICDCEGYEADLFHPFESKLDNLQAYDLIIECHDCFRPGIASNLIELFKTSHDVTVISSLPKQAKARRFMNVGSFSYNELLMICDERRPETMEWLVCGAR